MRILLDEYIDRRLASLLAGHDVLTVPQAGWAGKKNGELIALASSDFDAFVTVDRGLEFQQELSGVNLIIALLCSRTNRLGDLQSLVPELLTSLQNAQAGELIRVGDV